MKDSSYQEEKIQIGGTRKSPGPNNAPVHLEQRQRVSVLGWKSTPHPSGENNKRIFAGDEMKIFGLK